MYMTCVQYVHVCVVVGSRASLGTRLVCVVRGGHTEDKASLCSVTLRRVH